MPLPKQYTGPASHGASARTQALILDRYRMGKKLGSGHFGTVFLVTDTSSNNEKKVLKEIMIGDIKPDETVDAVKEAQLLAKLDHPSIVKFYDSFLYDEKFCIITEYCEGGDLDCRIQSHRQSAGMIEQSLILDWFVQLTNAVRYIHERRIVHRDLKTRNIFLRNDHIKLGDFGISRILMGTTDMATTFTGTPYYMSPEVLKHDGYNAKSDIWSLGAILYELCTLQHAFQAQSLMAVMYKIVEQDPPTLPDHFPDELKKLLKRLLDKTPQNRPSATEILQDPFIKSHMQSFSRQMSIKLTGSKKEIAENDAAAIKAVVMNPMKKSQLLTDSDTARVMSPREKMNLRKQQKADQQAAELKRVAQENLSEARKRHKERKLKEGSRAVAPWLEEHPEVFNDPNFSLSVMAETPSECRVPPILSPDTGNGCQVDSMEVSAGVKHHPGNMIPEDPVTAETYYTEYADDFEEDLDEDSEMESVSDDGDYEALVECIEDALDLPSSSHGTPDLQEMPLSGSTDPYAPVVREQKIKVLRSQCISIYGAESFEKVYRFIRDARSRNVDEPTIMAGLRKLVANVRDCFQIDQLIFLERQMESSPTHNVT